MASWSSRRKLSYATIVILVIVISIALLVFFFFYSAPTCFDGKRNGDELDIDCGGSCVRLCQSAFLPPRQEWGGAKIEKLADGLYNVASYIVNPNVSGAAIDVPYKISMYDSEGSLITERSGKINLYAHHNALAFQPAIDTDESIPAKAIFEFTSPPDWFKSGDELGGLVVVDKKYEESANGSSLEIILVTRTLYPYEDIRVGAVLYDAEGNVIGFSQTIVDEIPPKGREIAPFTWSINRDGRVTTIEVLPTVEP